MVLPLFVSIIVVALLLSIPVLLIWTAVKVHRIEKMLEIKE